MTEEGKFVGVGGATQRAVNYSGNYLFPHVIRRDEPYSCFYCNCHDEPLIQFGYEASTREEWESGKRRVSPEDANAVEICFDCLIVALNELGREIKRSK